MLKILIVDDDQQKVNKILSVINEFPEMSLVTIEVAPDIRNAE